MFQFIRKATDALNALAKAISGVEEVLLTHYKATLEGHDLAERVARIEIGRAKWEAEVEAHLLRADSVFKNARNAEERTRAMAAKNAGADLFPEEGEDVEDPVLSDDAEGGPEEGLYPLRLGMAANNKATAMRAKFL